VLRGMVGIMLRAISGWGRLFAAVRISRIDGMGGYRAGRTVSLDQREISGIARASPPT